MSNYTKVSASATHLPDGTWQARVIDIGGVPSGNPYFKRESIVLAVCGTFPTYDEAIAAADAALDASPHLF